MVGGGGALEGLLRSVLGCHELAVRYELARYEIAARHELAAMYEIVSHELATRYELAWLAARYEHRSGWIQHDLARNDYQYHGK